MIEIGPGVAMFPCDGAWVLSELYLTYSEDGTVARQRERTYRGLTEAMAHDLGYCIMRDRCSLGKH